MSQVSALCGVVGCFVCSMGVVVKAVCLSRVLLLVILCLLDDVVW